LANLAKLSVELQRKTKTETRSTFRKRNKKDQSHLSE